MPSIQKVCEICGKAFSVWPSRANTARTCSKACGSKLAAARYESERSKKPCANCGKVFSFPKCHEGRRTCCSTACAAQQDAQRQHKTGADSLNWKGGKTGHTSGYLYSHVDQHPFGSHGRYVLEHRLVMEAWMREAVPGHRFLIEIDGALYLRPEIEVHHINENKRDNRPKNLLACTAASHRLIHNGNPPMQGEVWPEVQGMVAYAPSKVTCTCLQCGTQFQKKRSDVARGSGKYCSRSCYDKRPRESFEVVPL